MTATPRPRSCPALCLVCRSCTRLVRPWPAKSCIWRVSALPRPYRPSLNAASPLSLGRSNNQTIQSPSTKGWQNKAFLSLVSCLIQLLLSSNQHLPPASSFFSPKPLHHITSK
ncbi:hypothetical protein M431DRAFT_345026 [Trichoderma harzianum CBS 226.95]|uniref:Uncharacterized protein n=1 Tax=Trichoderma harzianum CBS 226.95 TaxID=983964 RepID=A0A2T4AKM1_TRIHA|nr:hypothetical protein M431DRAFT_345026 [Trichoderma harzianum CBS 226.95]PTB57603.1 hypothetical protein M431DRAFT_345026 [Trichoderma harzianum CBS 226.95]